MSRTGMRSALRASLAAGTAAAAFAVVLVAPGTAQAASYDDCPPGDVCFYNGANGSGKMCKWDGDDPEWRNGAVYCRWAATDNVRSVPLQQRQEGRLPGRRLLLGQGLHQPDRLYQGRQEREPHRYVPAALHKWVTSC